VITPPSLAFRAALGTPAPDPVTVTVTSIDNHPLRLMAISLNQPPRNFAAFNTTTSFSCNGVLNPGDTCSVNVNFSNLCPGEQLATLMVSTDSGAAYTVPIQGVGLPATVSLKLEDGTVLSDDSQAKPNEQHTVGLTLSPALDARCTQTPTLAMSFSPQDPDDKNGTNYDIRFDPATSVLQTGTVAGNITLKTQVAGKDIELVSGSGSVTLQSPSQTGVIQKVSIGNRTASTFEVAITGFSTPRETGPTATTEVCFAFTSAKGASVDVNSQFCALKQDIEIWYERPSSFPFGSQFSGSVIVSFSGDGKAIGGVQAWVRNKKGDSAPYCVDFQSGNQQDCPK